MMRTSAMTISNNSSPTQRYMPTSTSTPHETSSPIQTAQQQHYNTAMFTHASPITNNNTVFGYIDTPTNHTVDHGRDAVLLKNTPINNYNHVQQQYKNNMFEQIPYSKEDVHQSLLSDSAPVLSNSLNYQPSTNTDTVETY